MQLVSVQSMSAPHMSPSAWWVHSTYISYIRIMLSYNLHELSVLIIEHVDLPDRFCKLICLPLLLIIYLAYLYVDNGSRVVWKINMPLFWLLLIHIAADTGGCCPYLVLSASWAQVDCHCGQCPWVSTFSLMAAPLYVHVCIRKYNYM